MEDTKYGIIRKSEIRKQHKNNSLCSPDIMAELLINYLLPPLYIGKSELPAILASGSVVNSKGSFDYYQKLVFDDRGSGYVQFKEDDKGIAGLFLNFENGRQIARYVMEFSAPFESDVDDGNGSADVAGLFLTDYEDVGFIMLGKRYVIVNFFKLKSEKYQST